LRSEVLADEPPEKINHEEGNQPCQNLENRFPEFENNNYILMGENNAIDINEINLEEINENQNISSKLTSIFKKVGKEIEKKARIVSNKFKEMEIGDKFKAAGQKSFIVMQRAGKFVVKKSKPMYEKISEKTKEGASSLTKKSKEIYSELKTKLTGKETLKGEMPVSDYYELNARPQASHENIFKYIDDKEDNPVRVQQIQARQDSFRLLTDSNENLGQVEGKLFINY
jgi:hypothetical protein